MHAPLPHPQDSKERASRPALPLQLVAKDGRAIGTQGCCRECGHTFIGKRTTKEFCGAACRRAFNNRKATRGAQMYDLIMAMRFDRHDAKTYGAWKLLDRMAAAARAEDERDRAGRRSWDDVRDVKGRNAHLLATVVGVNIAGRRR